MNVDEQFMALALDQAALARDHGEVPVGAVLVDSKGAVVAKGYNQPISACDPSGHAEIVVLREAGRVCGNYRFPDMTLYVTIEPCMMCVGALIHARIARVVIGAREPRSGALLSHPYNASHDCWNHSLEVEEGILENECGTIMKQFFAARRQNKKSKTV